MLEGKKAEYNELILKSLIEGEKTNSQISEYISQHSKEAKTKRDRDKRHIGSVISRKGARLEELQKKECITHENAYYKLTNKGELIAWALTSKEELTQRLLNKEFELDLKKSREELERDMPLYARSFPMIFDLMLTPEHFFLLREITSDLIKKGADIDNMNNDDFKNLVLSMSALHYQNLELIKNVSVQKNIYRNIPKINRKTKRLLKKQKGR